MTAIGEPKFITWKKYGFRHIVNDSSEPRKIEGRGGIYPDGVVQIKFNTLCSNDGHYSNNCILMLDGKDYHYGFDPFDTRRPLCGTCRKIWEKKTKKVS
jgi:hypothetical protein